MILALRWHWGGTCVRGHRWGSKGRVWELSWCLVFALTAALRARCHAEGLAVPPGWLSLGQRAHSWRWGSVELPCPVPRLRDPLCFRLCWAWPWLSGFPQAAGQCSSWWGFSGKFTEPSGSLCAPATCASLSWGTELKGEGMGKGSHCAENSLFSCWINPSKRNKTTSDLKPGTCLGKHCFNKIMWKGTKLLLVYSNLVL